MSLQNTCAAPTYTTCSQPYADCQADQAVFPATGQPPASSQSFGGSDTSWPDLLPVCLPATAAKQLTGSQVYLVLPASYVDSSGAYRFMRMPTRPSGPVVDYDFQEDTECADTVKPWFNGYCDYTQIISRGSYFPPAYNNQHYNLFDTNVSYSTMFASSKTGANVVSGCDASFAPSQLFQFFYSASVPLNAYSQLVTVTPQPTVPSNSCQAQGYTSCGCNTYLTIPTGDGIIKTVDGVAYTKDNVTSNFMSYSLSSTAIGSSTCSPAMVLPYSKHASMRDGLDRLASTKQVPNEDNCPSVSGMLDTIIYTFASSYNGFDAPSSSYELAFPSGASCSLPDLSGQPTCKYLMDWQDSKFRDLALSIKVNTDQTDQASQTSSGSNNVWFAQTVADSKNNLFVKSFNVAGRLPGCVPTGSASLPTSASPYLATKLSDIFVVGARTASGSKLFHWGVTRNLGNTGQPGSANQQGNTYVPEDGPAWNKKSDDYASWPDLTSLRANTNNTWLVDITARVVFFNPWLTDPVRSVMDSKLQLTDQAVRQFSQNCQALFAQNTPNWTTSTACDQLYVRAFERGVAFLEYIACLVYSLVFNFNLDDSVNRQDYFDLATCLAGTADQTVASLLGQLAVPSKPTSQLPSLLDQAREPSMTCQQEFDAWCVYVAKNADQFMRLPVFSYQSGQLVVTMYVPPVIHAVLSSQPDSLNDNLATLLNCFLQDLPVIQPIEATKTGLVDQMVSVFRNNVNYIGLLGNRNPAIALQGAKLADSSQHLSVQSKQTGQAYVASWAWTASVSMLSVGALLYLLANLPSQASQPAQPAPSAPSWLVQLAGTDVWTTNPALPVLTATNAPGRACLASKDSTDCARLLCQTDQDCLCDYSVWVGTSKNLSGSYYFNNSAGLCACLASDSYPVGQNQLRANNLVSRCFANQCAGLAPSDQVCSQQACKLFEQVVEAADKLDPANWFLAFNDQSDVDLDKLNRVCDLDLVHRGQSAPDRSFKLDWMQLAASICLAMAVPAGWLAWLVTFNTFDKPNTPTGTPTTPNTPTTPTGRTGKFVRVRLGWRVVLAVIGILLAVLAGLLCYALSGVPKCERIDAKDYQPAGCVDRLIGRVRLSSDACQTQFCQCDQAGLPCQTASGKPTGPTGKLCTAMGVCTNCEKNSQVDLVAQRVLLGDFSTRQLYLALGCAALLASVLLGVGTALVRKRLPSAWHVGLVVMLPGLVCLVAFAVLVWQAMTTQTVQTSISAARQQRNTC